MKKRSSKSCPLCGAPLNRDTLLGRLGSLEHHQCRACGVGVTRYLRASSLPRELRGFVRTR